MIQAVIVPETSGMVGTEQNFGPEAEAAKMKSPFNN